MGKEFKQLGLFDTPKPAMPEIAPDNPNVALFVSLLEGRSWVPAKQILIEMEKPVTEDSKRWLRALRRASTGRIAGGPGMPGYKLVLEMTAEEYGHWRNTMRSQTREMLRCVLQADKVFYRRGNVEVPV
ncbi:MAG: hypothetical protein V4587_00225 [Acidobacteriota bacterium]